MNKKPSKKNLVIAVVIIVVIGAVYFYFKGGSAPESSSLQVQPSDSLAIGSQVLVLLNQIQSLKIDSTLFKDPAYQTLRDYSVAIPPQNVGRVNPFAPLPGVSSAPAGR